MANISVYFAPALFSSDPYYHEFIVYTDDSGNQYFIRGGPSVRESDSIDIGAVTGGNGGPGPYGYILVTEGSYILPSVDYAPPGTYYSQILTTAPQSTLGPIWASMSLYAASLNSAADVYAAAGPNSNSVVTAVLQYAGLPLPQGNSLDGAHPAPGADIPLTAATSSSPYLQAITDISGLAETEIQNVLSQEVQQLKAAYQNALDGIVGGFSAFTSYITGNSSGDGVTKSAGQNGSQTFTVSGSQTAGIQGAAFTFNSANVLTTYSFTESGQSYLYNYDPLTETLASSKLVNTEGDFLYTVYQPSTFTGIISNFTVGDTIDLAGVSAGGAVLEANNVLYVQGTGISLQLDPTQDLSGYKFVLSPDDYGGTDIALKSFLNIPQGGTGSLSPTQTGPAIVQIGNGATLIATTPFSGTIEGSGTYHVITDYTITSLENDPATSYSLTEFKFWSILQTPGGSTDSQSFCLEDVIESSTGADTVNNYAETILLDPNVYGGGQVIDGMGTNDEKILWTFVTVACFLQGTLIATDQGEFPVEALTFGTVPKSKYGKLSTISWLGHRHIDCRRHPKPVDVWPVRISPHAFGPGMPHSDLWLSPDHAVFVDGVLIPIRYLINGKTIAQEARDEVTYWHVELEQHDVILAEGLPCESYLDTGNRSAFANGGPTVQLHPDFALRVWEAQACAPLVREVSALTRIKSVLREHAQTLGYASTRDPALFLISDDLRVTPLIDGRVYRFELPPQACGIQLVSRSAIPAHVRDDSDDYRQLGVAVSRIILDGRVISLTDARLSSGWHDYEGDSKGTGWRWTDGDAGLAIATGRVLEIEVAMTERYWLEPATSDAGQAAAA